MSLWKIALRSIQHRSLASSLTALSMSLGVALVVTVLVINGVVSKTFQQGAQGYDLIVGAKGSKLQLVLSTVFYNQDPLAPIPYRYYELMKTSRYSAEVEAAIPIARGDSYNGFPVVATNTDYFRRLLKSDGQHYTLHKGEFFKNADLYSVVVGYTVAKKSGLRVGDTIRFGHTGRDVDLHDPFTIVGILDHTGSPNDRAVFVNLEGFYKQHENPDGTFQINYDLVEQEAAQKLAQMKEQNEQEQGHEDHAHDAHEDHAHDAAEQQEGSAPHQEQDADHDHAAESTPESGNPEHGEQGHVHDESCGHDHDGNRRLTAILLITREQSVDVSGTMDQIDALAETQPGVAISEGDLVTTKKKKVYNSAVTALPAKIEGELLEAQAVAPVREISAFFQDVIGNIQKILIIFAIQVIIVAGIGMMVSIYNSMNERRQEIAIMRALGARRITVMSIILFESILLSLGGGLLGVLIGHGLVAVINPWIMEYSNVMVRPWDFQLAELILIPGLVALASIVGYLPAVIAYRTDVAQSLQP
ncbi:MAG: ABC transporter permease [Planctomycetia bacterium]|nr:ABC transporter permease [Planctomycetia bacterium]